MKFITACAFAIFLACSVLLNVSAQAAETIWITANTQSYKKGETVVITVNAASATPVQGFTFQISYDPDCLKPVNAASPIPSMNGLSLPQTEGLVDASFASTTPQVADGVLAEVQFTALAGCQTNLVLQSAALAVRNESGFAAALPGVTVGEKSIALNIDKAAGESQPLALLGTPLPLGVETSSGPKTFGIVIIVLAILMLAVVLFVFFKLLRKKPSTA